MSSAFLKNETADAPVVIPARAPLPPGATNYVTAHGLDLLRNELTALETEHARSQTEASEENDRMRQLALLNGQIANLNQRIASAKVVDPANQPHDEVRFGATVTIRTKTGSAKGTERRFTIVGVDEANASHGCIAFTAPLARAMQGKRVGEEFALRTVKGEEVLLIMTISYADR
ncbi:GreA/GreB family elongation factor [Spirosoma rigui]|uniref:GreA/GreB family elongation factor n=1 Tax=Spirosoma rigui TaxID=564064 RepID=UPI0009AF5F55|nr:GreA/GreB family elongation factor [Spirosoma rigui]